MPFLMYKTDSRRDLDTAFTGRTQQKTFPFQSFSIHTSTVSKKLSLQQLICKRKQKTTDLPSTRGQNCTVKQIPEEILGCLYPTPCAQGKKKIPERGQKLSKQLSTQILINLGLCCRMGSWKAWQKSNAATGTEVNIKREGALDYEYSNRLTASPTCTEEQRFYINSLCFCTTPQQLFSDKPFSMHGIANTCMLAREESVLVTCKTLQSITRTAKQYITRDPCLHIINKFIFFQTHLLLCIAAYWL